MSDINETLSDQEIKARAAEAGALLENKTLMNAFHELEKAYITRWVDSDQPLQMGGEAPNTQEQIARRGTLWVKVKCLEDLKLELKQYLERAAFADSGEAG